MMVMMFSCSLAWVHKLCSVYMALPARGMSMCVLLSLALPSKGTRSVNCPSSVGRGDKKGLLAR